jgi:hypothetical protein
VVMKSVRPMRNDSPPRLKPDYKKTAETVNEGGDRPGGR